MKGCTVCDREAVEDVGGWYESEYCELHLEEAYAMEHADWLRKTQKERGAGW